MVRMDVFGVITLFILLLHYVNCGLITTANDPERFSSKTVRVHHAHKDAEKSRDNPRVRRTTSSSDSPSDPRPKVEVVGKIYFYLNAIDSTLWKKITVDTRYHA